MTKYFKPDLDSLHGVGAIERSKKKRSLCTGLTDKSARVSALTSVGRTVLVVSVKTGHAVVESYTVAGYIWGRWLSIATVQVVPGL